MNKPYVKKYNELGELVNPINGVYPSRVFLGYQKNKSGEKEVILELKLLIENKN